MLPSMEVKGEKHQTVSFGAVDGSEGFGVQDTQPGVQKGFGRWGSGSSVGHWRAQGAYLYP